MTHAELKAREIETWLALVDAYRELTATELGGSRLRALENVFRATIVWKIAYAACPVGEYAEHELKALREAGFRI